MNKQRSEVLKKYILVRDLLDEISEMLKTVEFTSEEIKILKSIADVIEDRVIDLQYLKEEKNSYSGIDDNNIPF